MMTDDKRWKVNMCPTRGRLDLSTITRLVIGQQHYDIERKLELVIKPNPRWMPKFLHDRILRFFLEMHYFQTEEPPVFGPRHAVYGDSDEEAGPEDHENQNKGEK